MLCTFSVLVVSLVGVDVVTPIRLFLDVVGIDDVPESAESSGNSFATRKIPHTIDGWN